MNDWIINDPLTEEDFQSIDFFLQVFENYKKPSVSNLIVKSMFNLKTLDGGEMYLNKHDEHQIKNPPDNWYIGIVFFDGLKFWQTFVKKNVTKTIEIEAINDRKKKMQSKLRRLKKKYKNDDSLYQSDVEYQSLNNEIISCKNRLKQLKLESTKNEDILLAHVLVPYNKISEEYTRLFSYYERLWEDDDAKQQLAFLDKKKTPFIDVGWG